MNAGALLLNFLVANAQNIAAIGAMLQKAAAENRDVTPDEVLTLFGGYDLDRAQLLVHIAAAKAAGH